MKCRECGAQRRRSQSSCVCVCTNEEQGIRPTHTTRYESRAEPAPIDAPREAKPRDDVRKAEPAEEQRPPARARIDMSASLDFDEEDDEPVTVVPGQRTRCGRCSTLFSATRYTCVGTNKTRNTRHRCAVHKLWPLRAEAEAGAGACAGAEAEARDEHYRSAAGAPVAPVAVYQCAHTLTDHCKLHRPARPARNDRPAEYRCDQPRDKQEQAPEQPHRASLPRREHYAPRAVRLQWYVRC